LVFWNVIRPRRQRRLAERRMMSSIILDI
jgi:hypothetical protein